MFVVIMICLDWLDTVKRFHMFNVSLFTFPFMSTNLSTRRDRVTQGFLACGGRCHGNGRSQIFHQTSPFFFLLLLLFFFPLVSPLGGWRSGVTSLSLLSGWARGRDVGGETGGEGEGVRKGDVARWRMPALHSGETEVTAAWCRGVDPRGGESHTVQEWHQREVHVYSGLELTNGNWLFTSVTPQQKL